MQSFILHIMASSWLHPSGFHISLQELYVCLCSLDTMNRTNAGNGECFLTVSPWRHSSVQRQSDRSRCVKNEKEACERSSNSAYFHTTAHLANCQFWKVKIIVTLLEDQVYFFESHQSHELSCELV